MSRTSANFVLMVGRQVTPIGVMDANPPFAWKPVGESAKQLSYRIVVLRRQLGAATEGDLVWDTGVVVGQRTHEIRYEGSALRSSCRYDWTVTLECSDGVRELSSYFETGKLSPLDWSEARWIAAPRDPIANGAAPTLTRTTHVPEGFTAARLYAAAGGLAATSINGEATSDAVLSPPFADYDRRLITTVEDVTGLVVAGDNRLSVDLGRGFFGLTNPNPPPAWGWDCAPWHDEPCVLLELRVFYPDGSSLALSTDSRWQSRRSATIYDDLYGGESYDEHAVGNEWSNAVEVLGPAGKLVGQTFEPIRVVDRLEPTSISRVHDDLVLIEFPRVVSGWLSIRVPEKFEDEIVLRFGEKLADDGLPNYSDGQEYFGHSFQRDSVRLGNRGDRTWHPRFTYHGFKYVLMEGWPTGMEPRTEWFEAQVVHNDVRKVGNFTSSSSLLNRIHDNVVRTLQINLHGLPTDTPTYEKNGWTGDGMLGAEMFLRNLDAHNLLAKWVQDIEDARRPDGRPRVIAPNPGWEDQFTPSPTWDSAYVLVPWWIYYASEDLVILERHYEGMRKYSLLEYQHSDDGIATTKLNDWVSPETSARGGGSPDDPRVSATAFLYRTLTAMFKIAEALGRDSDATLFQAKAERVRRRFNDEFFDPVLACVRGHGDAGFRQTHAVLALAFGLIPIEHEAPTARRLAEDVIARGGLNTGALGTKWLLPMLSRFGYDEVALDIALSERYPSWGYWIANGATTTWEHWKLESRSRAHYFLGTVDDWLFERIVGIRAMSPGYADMCIDPIKSDRLSWARGSVDTPRGVTSVEWSVDGDLYTLEAVVPPGAQASIVLPGGVVVEGLGSDQSDRSFTRKDDEDQTVRVAAGTHRFVVSRGSEQKYGRPRALPGLEDFCRAQAEGD